jgi:glycosyltransferase involved in cell wall biosynthesis
MKVAFVVPRFGADIRGGAEVGARMLAERLVADRGFEVEVLTTCALDAITWRDEVPEGTSVERGVTVRRIRSQAGRNEHFHPLWAQLMEDPGAASPEDCAKWVAWQGPLATDLVEAVAASDADVVAFYPYLYYPTVYGLPLVRERAVLHPAAHEEPALHLPVFDELFRMCRGFAFHSRSERTLVNARFGVASTPQVLIGLGVEVPDVRGSGGSGGAGGTDSGSGDAPGELGAEAAEQAVRSSFGVGAGDEPYLVCIGRVDDQKGTGMLWRWFRSYKERHPGPLKLVFIGQVVNAPEAAHDVVLTGMVDDATKWALLRGARALVAPSPHESFSLTVVEALTVGVPVLVHAQCGATREHCERSGAGLWFGDYAEFESALELLTTDDEVHAGLAANGLRYVEANFRWPVILDRYCAFLDRFGGGRGQGNGMP